VLAVAMGTAIGKNGQSCVKVAPVTRTSGILAYSRLKALAVNGAGHPADVDVDVDVVE